MKLSAQEEYGLRCMLTLARAEPGASLTIPQIAEIERISGPNVAKLLRALKRGGYVVALRGQSGGYALARKAGEINVGEVLACLGGRIFDAGFCGRHSSATRGCGHNSDCSVRSVWRLVQSAVDDVLSRLTLADLLVEEAGVSVPERARRLSLPIVQVS
ncbi:MAG: Rrf2 family transcriptional regulator [Vicinamibacteria bacterium]|nr:Rrf2 family transcriptional regulator [Vicinamibacteria bacterium]